MNVRVLNIDRQEKDDLELYHRKFIEWSRETYKEYFLESHAKSFEHIELVVNFAGDL
jgi:hypothetical protein